MKHFAASFFAAFLLLGAFPVFGQGDPDDGKGLARGGDKYSVTISGVSSGAAMAMQYAVANSASIVGVGAIAGPGWGCAEGQFSRAIEGCMCGREPVGSKITDALRLAYGTERLFDPLDPETRRPRALKRSYVFHSAADKTVVERPGRVSIEFLRQFTGTDPVEDWGTPGDGSDRAGHGILSRYGTDSCTFSGEETTYIRDCRKHDNARSLFRALYGDLPPGREREEVPGTTTMVWEFKQEPFIKAVRHSWPKPIVPADMYLPRPHRSDERLNFDLAKTGYLYVPRNCRGADRKCGIHVALHGCKQDPETFARMAGYNYWAEKYDVIVVYPAVKAYTPIDLNEGEVCRESARWPLATWKAFDGAWAEANYNGCWDWWGYLDSGNENLEETKTRYLTKEGPQMKFIRKIIEAVTADTPQG